MSLSSELAELAELHKQGALNDAEFEAAKEKLLKLADRQTQEGSFLPPTPPIHPRSFTFKNVVKNGYRDWRVFSARSSRKEFWLWVLYVVMISYALNLVRITCVAFDFVDQEDSDGVVGLLFLPTLVPSISMWVRRLHDTGHRAWWGLVPLVNLIFLCSETDLNEKRWARTTST